MYSVEKVWKYFPFNELCVVNVPYEPQTYKVPRVLIHGLETELFDHVDKQPDNRTAFVFQAADDDVYVISFWYDNAYIVRLTSTDQGSLSIVRVNGHVPTFAELGIDSWDKLTST